MSAPGGRTRSTVSTGRGLALAALTAVAGVGVGLGAHAVSEGARSATVVDSGQDGSARTSPASRLLGEANVLAPADLAGVSPERLTLDTLAQSEGQEALPCQRQALDRVATVGGLLKAVYLSSPRQLILAEEVVVSVDVPPQVDTLERTLATWHEDCGVGRRTPSEPVDLGVEGARAWSLPSIGKVPWYAVVVRSEDRVAWLSLTPYDRPVDPAGLADVARAMLDRLDAG
ncbi:MAG: hypothetical protein U0R78_17775 [Nocardioidaceae bacterium]